MATRGRHQETSGRRSTEPENESGSAEPPALTKLDKSGLYDLQQVKRLLDDQVVLSLEEAGYVEDGFAPNFRIIAGAIAVALAIYSHFNGYEYPDNRLLIMGCVTGYAICVTLIYIVSWIREGNAFFVGSVKAHKSSSESKHILAPKIWAHTSLGLKGSSLYTVELRREVRERTSADAARLSKPYENYFFEDGHLALTHLRRDLSGLIARVGKSSSKDD